MKITSLMIAIFAMVHLTFLPLADAKKAQDRFDSLKTYFERTQLLKKQQTIGTLVQSLDGQVHPDDFKIISGIFSNFSDVETPQLKLQKIKENGLDVVRVFANFGKEQKIVDFYNTDTVFMKIGATVITPDDVSKFVPFVEKLNKAFGDSSRVVASNVAAVGKKVDFKLDPAVYDKLSPQQKVEYRIKLREVIDTMEDLQYEQEQKKFGKKTVQHKLFNIFLEEASAAGYPSKGDKCVYAGYMTEYGTVNGKTSCGLGKPEFAAGGAYRCEDGGLKCNPAVYGHVRDGGQKAHCVPATPASERKKATSNCDQASPLNRDKNGNPLSAAEKEKNVRALVKSMTKDDLSPESMRKFITEINTGLKQSVEICDSVKYKQPDDQIQACQVLRDRFAAMNEFACETFATSMKSDKTIKLPDYCEGIVTPPQTDDGDGAGSDAICKAEEGKVENKDAATKRQVPCLCKETNTAPVEGKCTAATVPVDPRVEACTKRGGEFKPTDGTCWCKGAVNPLLPGESCNGATTGSGTGTTSGTGGNEPGFFSKLWSGTKKFFSNRWVQFFGVLGVSIWAYNHWKVKSTTGVIQNDDLTDRSTPINQPSVPYRPIPGLYN